MIMLFYLLHNFSKKLHNSHIETVYSGAKALFRTF